MQFANIPGNSELKNKLTHRLKNNTAATNILLIDKNGYGGLAFALAYIKLLSCKNITGSESCNYCDSCLKHNQLVHPDVHFSYPFFISNKPDVTRSADVLPIWRKAVLANPFIGLEKWSSLLTSNNNFLTISSKECHEMIKALSLTPLEGNYKFLVIWHAEYLGKNANIILKLLEQSNVKNVIISICANKQNLLSTYASRFEIMELKPISAAALKYFVTSKNHKVDNLDLNTAVNNCENSISQLLDLIHDEGNMSDDTIKKWLRLVYSGQIESLLSMITENICKMDKQKQKHLLISILNLLLKGLEYRYKVTDYKNCEPCNFTKNFSKTIDNYQTRAMYNVINSSITKLEKNVNSKILFLDVSLQLNSIFKYTK